MAYLKTGTLSNFSNPWVSCSWSDLIRSFVSVTINSWFFNLRIKICPFSSKDFWTTCTWCPLIDKLRLLLTSSFGNGILLTAIFSRNFYLYSELKLRVKIRFYLVVIWQIFLFTIWQIFGAKLFLLQFDEKTALKLNFFAVMRVFPQFPNVILDYNCK